MAYRRAYRLSYRRRRYPARRSTVKRRTTRRSPRTYRSRPRLPKMTKKRILNVTSRKKQDNMLSYINPVVGDGAAGGVTITANERYWVFAFIATARNADYQLGGPRGIVTDDATRTATRCFMRGIRENIRLETTTNHAYLWRRICFTFTGPELIRDATTGVEYPFWAETSDGFRRSLTQLLPGIPPATVLNGQLLDILFKGVVNVDWDQLITAKTDNRRLKIMYDRTRRITSANDVGKMLDVKLWHPMNKNLVYNDDEQGGGKLVPYLSAVNRSSMGDYYIIDIFDTGITGVGADALTFTPQSALYWHEK